MEFATVDTVKLNQVFAALEHADFFPKINTIDDGQQYISVLTDGGCESDFNELLELLAPFDCSVTLAPITPHVTIGIIQVGK
jgi:hypothetical protein